MKYTQRKAVVILVIFIMFLSSLAISPVIHAAESRLPEGTYSVDYRYLKDNTTETSTANYYLYVPDSGKLIIQGDKIIFEHEITKENYEHFRYLGYRLPGFPKAVISGSTVTGMEGYQEIQIRPITSTVVQSVYDSASSSTNADNWIVQIEVEDIKTAPDILMHIYIEDVPGFGTYDHWYNVQLELDTSQLPWLEVDKNKLIELLSDSEKFYASMKIQGTLDPGVYSSGEYPSTSRNRLLSQINNATSVVNDVYVSQAQVDTAHNNLYSTLDAVQKDQFNLTDSVQILVLDSINDDAQVSEHATDFGEKAAILRQASSYLAYANVPFKNVSDDVVVRFGNAQSTGAFSTSILNTANLVRSESDNIHAFYQAAIRHRSADDNNWQGLAFIQYIDKMETKEVYISFNADYLTTLNREVSIAQKLLEQAKFGVNPGEYAADSELKESLQDSLNHAQDVAGKLAATRAQLTVATNALDQALTNFLNSKNWVKGTYTMRLEDIGEDFNHYIQKAQVLISEDRSAGLQITPKTGIEVQKLVHRATGEEMYPTTKETGEVERHISSTPNHTVLFTDIDVTAHYTLVLIDADRNEVVFSARFAAVTAEPDQDDDHSKPNPGTGGGSGSKPDNNTPNEKNENGTDADLKDLNPPASNEAIRLETSPSIEKISFSDVSNHWAQQSIEQALELGIISGYPDGTFKPDTAITRGEFAVLISRALQLIEEADESHFDDYKEIPTWAQAHVLRAAAAGLITGYEDRTFRPASHLTRAQLAVIITRAAKLELEEGVFPEFADTEQVPWWAQKEIAAAVQAGLIEGYNNLFLPQNKATRAETLTLIIRLLDEGK